MTKQTDRFDALFHDLEAQMAAEERLERLAQVPDLVRESLAEATLSARLAAACSTRVDITAAGAQYAGVLKRVGRDWALLDCEGPVLIALAAVQTLRVGSREHSDGDVLLGLGMGSPLREIQETGGEVRARLRGDGVLDGVITAVAADYLELRSAGRSHLVPMSALEVVQVL